VEVMTAISIGAFISLVMVGALRAVTAGAKMVEQNIAKASEVRFAARMLKRDLENMYRPKDTEQTKFIAYSDDSGELSSAYMVFYTVNRAKARPFEPEGDIYEVEYYLMVDEEKSVLMRRLWPNPDDDFEPGGILTTVAEGIEVFQARYFDGQEWAYEWPEEMQSIPLLMEITLAGIQSGAGQPMVESFYMNFARSTGSSLEGEGETETGTSGETSD